LSSIFHETPVIALGYALYDIAGLTNKWVGLEEFWHTQLKPDMELFEKYRRYLVKNTQLNASFYGKMPAFE
jgi:capsular polysaccharide export protein